MDRRPDTESRSGLFRRKSVVKPTILPAKYAVSIALSTTTAGATLVLQ